MSDLSNSKLRALEPCISCFKNQNKIGFNRYILCCSQIKKAESRFAMFFQAIDGCFKNLCTVVKTRISGLIDEKAFRKVSHMYMMSKVKQLFNLLTFS